MKSIGSLPGPEFFLSAIASYPLYRVSAIVSYYWTMI